jgi:hypothetical protein
MACQMAVICLSRVALVWLVMRAAYRPCTFRMGIVYLGMTQTVRGMEMTLCCFTWLVEDVLSSSWSNLLKGGWTWEVLARDLQDPAALGNY